jgi:hypothetical protein
MEHKGFTPGPWKVEVYPYDDQVQRINGMGWCGFAHVWRYTRNSDGVASATTLPIGEANARLIADAPNLLKERDELRERVRVLEELLGSARTWIKHAPARGTDAIATQAQLVLAIDAALKGDPS